MKIHVKNFRVREGDDLDLKERLTIVDPIYKSKTQYDEIPADHVEKLSALQHQLSQSDRGARAAVVVDQGRTRAGGVAQDGGGIDAGPGPARDGRQRGGLRPRSS